MWKPLLIKDKKVNTVNTFQQSEMALKKENAILSCIRENSYTDLNVNAIGWDDKN